MDDDFTAAVVADGIRFDARDAELLQAVDDRGSLHAASDVLGRSYARAHSRVEELEDAFGPLVVRRRGGPGGGGSRLTDGARQLLARFERLRAAFAGTAAAAETVLEGRVESRDGELLAVATDAGPLRALAGGSDPEADAATRRNVDGNRDADGGGDVTGSGGGDSDDDTGHPGSPERVQVAVRADAVTLHDPAEAPAEDATSARNRLSGTVIQVERHDRVATVDVDVGAERPLVALVTASSVDRLDLSPGAAVVASWKATTTRAVGHTPV